MKPIDIKNTKRLLIRSTNWIGDAVMTTPAVRAIKENFPFARISLLAKPWVAPVFEHSSHVDQIIIYDAKDRHKGTLGKLRLSKELRRYGFDAAILLQNAFEAALIAFLAGIPTRIGYSRDARGALLTHPIPCTKAIREVHQTQYYLNILSKAGLSADPGPLEIRLGREERHGALKILAEHGVGADEHLIGINPSATFGPAKQWFPERYAGLADKICDRYKTRVAVFGGPGDRALGEKIIGKMQHPAINFCGKTTLGEAMALIERCHLFVTNDSGLMHVGAALNVPLIAIFGSTDFVATGPLGSKSRIVRTSMACSPCLKPHCPLGHLECMKKIGVDMVFTAAGEFLKVDTPR